MTWKSGRKGSPRGSLKETCDVRAIQETILPQHNHLALGSYNHICQLVPSKVLHPMDGASKPPDSWGHLGSLYTLGAREKWMLSQEVRLRLKLGGFRVYGIPT